MRVRTAMFWGALILGAMPAFAEEAANPPVDQVPDQPRPAPRLARLLGTLFPGKAPDAVSAPAFDTTAAPPVDASAPPSPPPPTAPAKKPRVIVRLVVMPMPHLRPAWTNTAGAPGAADVSYEATGSIPFEPPPQSPDATVSVEPPPVAPNAAPAAPTAVNPPAAAPAAVVVAPPATPPLADVAEQTGGDDLLGDVTTYRAPDSTEMAPTVAKPDVVNLQKHPKAGDVPPLPPDVAIPLNDAPYQLLRTLQSVQDRIAQGVTAAVGAQRALLAEIDRQFAAAPPEVWGDRRNAEAAVTYVLSGGEPTILERLSTMDPKPAIDIRLVTGVLAYANGHEPEAWAALGGFNPLELPANMGAQVALAQSALAVRTDPQKAMQLLSLARLLAPGTLVEEAAIRRQLYVATQLKENEMVESLARQYLDRFRHSVYAGNFRLRFAAAISQMDIDSEANFARIDDMLSTVEAAARCQLYLTIASASIVKGHYTAGRLAAGRAATFTSAGSPEEAQARLYGAAALAADPKGFDIATTDFNGVNRGLLRASDQALYETVAVTYLG